ncbi:unnamed protein product [Arabis nemorensis]|uniref:Uncharacterized protein n=1 Tax=Arabis nemorensis TaxID=586526 RepID=A0A565B0E7_9BRAS|nr:unnamed protein product [Arabis nemorensis]
MGTESKGRAWFGKIYNKLETILVEVDTFTSKNTLCLKSSDPSDWESVRSEPEEVAEDRTSGICDLQKEQNPSCEGPSDPPSVQNFDISGYVRIEERVQGDGLNEDSSATSLLPDGEILSGAPLLEEYCNGNLTSATTLGDEEPIITDEESQITNTLTPQKCSAGDPSVFPGEESVEEDRVESCRDDVSIESESTEISVGSFETVVDSESTQSSTDDSNLNPIATKILDIHVQDNVAIMRSSNDGNLDAVTNGKSDISPSDSKALHSMEVREDPSFVDDNALYAVRLRTKKLRSYKRKIVDALTSKRRREKDYEELSIWFGDADMGSDLAIGEDSRHSKSSQVHEPEDSPWELL